MPEFPIDSAIPTLPPGFIISQPKKQRHDVYTGPGKSYLRVKTGKNFAYVSTNDWIKAYARDGDWLLIEYEVNNNVGNRMGYVQGKKINDFGKAPELPNADLPIRITRPCIITDDPNAKERVLLQVPKDLTGTLFCVHANRWGYVELNIDGNLVRGFVNYADFVIEYNK